MGWTLLARWMESALASDMEIYRALPCSTKRDIAPTDSSMGMFGSTLDMQKMSRVSISSRCRLSSHTRARYSGELPLREPELSGVLGLPDLVWAMTFSCLPFRALALSR